MLDRGSPREARVHLIYALERTGNDETPELPVFAEFGTLPEPPQQSTNALRILSDIGLTFELEGRFHSAERFYAHARTLGVWSYDLELRRVRNLIAIGDYSSALALLQIIGRDAAANAHVPKFFYELQIYSQLGNAELAERAFARLRGAHSSWMAKRLWPAVVRDSYLAAGYLLRGDLDEAEALYAELLATTERPYWRAVYRNRLTQIELARGKFFAALENTSQTIASLDDDKLGTGVPRTSPAVARAHHLAGRAARGLGDRVLAEYHLNQEVSLLRHMAGGDSSLTIPAHWELSGLAWARGDLEVALDSSHIVAKRSAADLYAAATFGGHLDRAQRSQALASRADYYVSLNVDEAPTDERAKTIAVDMLLAARGRAMLGYREFLEVARRRPLLRDSLRRLSLLVAKNSAKLYRRARGDRAPRRLLNVQYQRERRLAARSGYPLTVRASSERLTQELPTNTHVFIYARYQPYDPVSDTYGHAKYAGYRVSYGMIVAADLGTADVLDGQIQRYAHAIQRKQSLSPDRGERLYKALVAPLTEGVLEGDHLVVITDSTLASLPFSALPTDDGRYLIERHPVSYSLAVHLAIDWPDPVPDDGVVGFVNPQLSATAASVFDIDRDLPGTHEEASSLKAAHHDARILSKQDAAEVELRRMGGSHIIHIATHGFHRVMPTALPRRMLADEARLRRAPPLDPMQDVGFLLAPRGAYVGPRHDGVVSAMDVALMRFDRPALVFVSSCNSGSGTSYDGEGVLGLGRAFFLAGAPTTALAFWEVDDHATPALVAAFYEHLDRVHSPVIALTNAQRELAARFETNHPYYWANIFIYDRIPSQSAEG